MKPAEPLFHCDHCGRKNFTWRGLKAHVCRPVAPSSMAKAKSESKGAIVVLADPTLTVPKPQLKKFQVRTVDAIELIARTEADNVERRVLVGCALLIVKESAPHKEFLPWLKKNVTGAGYTQCTYFMRAARAFLDESEVGKPELLALTGNAATLQLGKKSSGVKLVGAVKNFVSGLTWTELLVKHKIKDKKKLGGANPPAPDGDDPAEPVDGEELAAQKREELSTWLELGRQLLVKENVCSYLPPADVRALDKSIDGVLTEWRDGLKTILKP